MPTRQELVAALQGYPEALHLRAKASKTSAELVELDRWYRNDLRDQVRERAKASNEAESEEGASWLTSEELSRLMRWKLARGKWRPRLQDMVATNSSSDLRAAFSDASVNSDHEAALKDLSKLKAVGPATASAILALWYPESEPFMSDEGIDYAAALEEGEKGKKTKREYTVKAWRTYREEMLERKEQEEWENVEELEMAIWAWAVLRKYGADEAQAVPEVNKQETSVPTKNKDEEKAKRPVKGQKRGAQVEPDVEASKSKKRKSS
ncbi:hypothetical protein JCM10908_006498 [Rhodotorula pacifica]|uniref:uncharacterized protein n=1 Tax=Rhodotorula pacifica TaxID=1495444 RepID=UPI003181AB17